MVCEWNHDLTQEEKEEAEWVINWAARAAMLKTAAEDEEEFNAVMCADFPCRCQLQGRGRKRNRETREGTGQMRPL